MNKPIVAASVIALVTAVALAQGPVRGQQDSKSIRLVYHSDTRGYYRPCG